MAGLVSCLMPRKVEYIRLECHREYSLNGNVNSIFLVPVGFFKNIHVCTQTLAIVHKCTYRKRFILHKDYIINHLRCKLVNSLEFS